MNTQDISIAGTHGVFELELELEEEVHTYPKMPLTKQNLNVIMAIVLKYAVSLDAGRRIAVRQASETMVETVRETEESIRKPMRHQ